MKSVFITFVNTYNDFKLRERERERECGRETKGKYVEREENIPEVNNNKKQKC